MFRYNTMAFTFCNALDFGATTVHHQSLRINHLNDNAALSCSDTTIKDILGDDQEYSDVAVMYFRCVISKYFSFNT